MKIIIFLSLLYAGMAVLNGDIVNGVFLSTPALFCFLLILADKIYKIK